MAKPIVPVRALPHTPPYKIHRYFARRPWNAFEVMIDAVSEVGDLVLDPFAGGGTTVYESAKLGRAVIGCDINPLSNFIVRNMVTKSNGEELGYSATRVRDFIREVSRINLSACQDCGGSMELEWAELQHVCACPMCDRHVPLSENNKLRPGVYACPGDSCRVSEFSFSTARLPRLQPRYVRLVASCSSCKVLREYEFDRSLEDQFRRNLDSLVHTCENLGIKLDRTEIPIHWDRQKEDLLCEKGFLFFSDLFTKRNFLINSLVKHYIITEFNGTESYEALRFILSDSLRDTNSMSFTNKRWQGGKPTTWSKHAYWLPNEFCEVDVGQAFWKSYKALANSHQFNEKHDFRGRLVSEIPKGDSRSPGEIFLHPGSLATLDLAPNSVDAVITDPPYGSNVQYLELSHFWFPWNKDIYQNQHADAEMEAVVNRKSGFDGAKGYEQYEENLHRVFSLAFQALKPGRNLALTFNNKDLRAWVALLLSIFRAGFRYSPESIVFQAGVQNYKQTAHTRFEGSPFGDFVYVFSKPQSFSDPTENSSENHYGLLVSRINEITSVALSLLRSGKSRDVVLTKYFDKLVLTIQELYISSNHQTEPLYELISSSALGKFYSESKR